MEGMEGKVGEGSCFNTKVKLILAIVKEDRMRERKKERRRVKKKERETFHVPGGFKVNTQPRSPAGVEEWKLFGAL